MKTSAKLNKVFPEADIRLLVDDLLQKNSEDMDKKRANQENKLLIKQLEKNRREAEKEKEKKSMHKHNELQGEILLHESDLKLLKDEARNDEKYYEKKKHQKQVEETEKDQQRREKAEAELNKKRCLQNQASIMEHFLKRSKINPSSQNDKVSTKSTISDLSSSKSESLFESATISMDCTLASSSDVTFEDIPKSHFSSWCCLGQSIRSNRKQR